MRRPRWMNAAWRQKAERKPTPSVLRDQIAVLLAFATVLGVGSAYMFTKGKTFLMPGPMASAHGAITNCSTCHTKSGKGKLSWVHGLVSGDPLADSKACLTCHQMSDTALNSHGASADVLKRSTERQTKIAAGSPLPQWAKAQSTAFPTHDVIAGGLYCATCHQEHQGFDFKLSKISNEQCSSCHVAKFNSFDGRHPDFDGYPFKKRTQIIYDHASHFGKHFPEVAKKDSSKQIPATCSTCHNSRGDKRIMSVAPFAQTCKGCHLDQISGKGRASGPKGIAFLTLPGLDLETLRKRNASIGEWPDASEAVLTPFMKVMISRTERGRGLINTVEGLNLLDLSSATEEQITAVTSLAWEIKGLFYGLISGKASEVLGNLNLGGGTKLSPDLVADLTASIPRDVVINAQLQWLPNLARQMASRAQGGPIPMNEGSGTAGSATEGETPRSEEPRDESTASAAASQSPSDEAVAREETQGSEPDQADPSDSTQGAADEAVSRVKRDPQSCLMRIFGQCVLTKEDETSAATIEPDSAASRAGKANLNGSAKLPSANKLGGAMRLGAGDLGKTTAKPIVVAQGADTAGNNAPASSADQPRGKAAGQTDDLLTLTDDELRALQAHAKESGRPARPAAAAARNGARGTEGTTSPTASAAANAQPAAAPVIRIDSDVDPESWAEYGGWYQQDYSIFYRPTGHKDKFIYSWLFITGPQAPRADTGPAAAVFDFLTSKDAQGSCTKCHSVDDIPGKGRVVNFGPPSAATKQGSFSSFIHEPHFGIMDNRGCLTCHSLEKDRPYLKSYEQGNPEIFASNFGSVKKELCQTCHTRGKARQDCLTCHKYHVNGVITPTTSTKTPSQ